MLTGIHRAVHCKFQNVLEVEAIRNFLFFFRGGLWSFDACQMLGS